jgi:uncharacterized protein (DUF1800 family)
MAAAMPDSSTWAPYKPSADAPWDRRRVVHLHRRAAFAASHAVIERDLADGPEASIDRILAGATHDGAAQHDFESLVTTIGDAAQASGSVERLQAWWYFRMLLSPDPLSERLALLWHNHFATSNRKVQDLVAMREQNELLRRHGRGPFGELLVAVVKHPAMLVWLDADSNRAGRPNENLARELLELFTLGIGHYEESDVQAAARALTGWTVGGRKFRFASQRHDDGELDLLGRRARLNGDELLDVLIDHPSTAHRVAWRLTTMFFGEGAVEDSDIEELAAGLRDHDLSIDWAVELILRSQLFFAEANIRTRVLGPIEFIVGALRALDLCEPPPSTLLLAEWGSRMGQTLFAPPNVGGWPEGRSWLSSRSVVARSNFAVALADGRLWNAMNPPDLARCIGQSPPTGDARSEFEKLAELLWGEAPPDALPAAHAAASETPSKPLSAALVALLSHPEAQLA